MEESIALGLGLDDVAIERHSVDDRGDEARIGHDLTPLGERQIGSDGDRCLLFSFGQDLGQQLSASDLELDIAKLVDEEQVEPSIAGNEPGEALRPSADRPAAV